jgi:Flp pilus assembly protein CpaB
VGQSRSTRPTMHVDAAARRRITRDWRHRLPSSRAVVGGILVALAAAGVFVGHRQASQPPTTRYVVATRAVAMGDALHAEDLGTITVELPRGVTAIPSDEATGLVGRVAATPLDELDLLRPGDVLEQGRFADPSSVEVSLELPPARALQGIIRDGSVVDVLSTDPDGEGTAVLARSVRVTSVSDRSEDGGIGASGAVRVLVSVPGTDAAAQLVDAAVRTDITLVLPRPTDEGTT